MNESNLASTFSFDRVFKYGKRFLYLKKKSILINIFGMIILSTAFALWSNYVDFSDLGLRTLEGTLINIILFMGLYLTSFVFDESKSPNTASQFFTFPITSLERFFFYWFFSFVLIFSFIGLVIFTLSISIDSSYSLSLSLTSKNTLSEAALLHSIFFFGAIYFKQNSFLSTLISIFLLITGLALLSITMSAFLPPETVLSMGDNFSITKAFTNKFFGFSVALVLWFLTYRRLSTKQAE